MFCVQGRAISKQGRGRLAVPVSSFTISGIGPAVDAANENGFPTYLEFDRSSTNFTMTPVPEPSTLLLLGVATLGLLGFLWRKRKSV